MAFSWSVHLRNVYFKQICLNISLSFWHVLFPTTRLVKKYQFWGYFCLLGVFSPASAHSSSWYKSENTVQFFGQIRIQDHREFSIAHSYDQNKWTQTENIACAHIKIKLKSTDFIVIFFFLS